MELSRDSNSIVGQRNDKTIKLDHPQRKSDSGLMGVANKVSGSRESIDERNVGAHVKEKI